MTEQREKLYPKQRNSGEVKDEVDAVVEAGDHVADDTAQDDAGVAAVVEDELRIDVLDDVEDDRGEGQGQKGHGDEQGDPGQLVLRRFSAAAGAGVQHPDHVEDVEDEHDEDGDVGVEAGRDPGPHRAVEVLMVRVDGAAAARHLIRPHRVDAHRH